MTAATDVLIAGGGLVGASLAAALVDTGLTVTVVEAAAPDTSEPPSFDRRHTALAPTSQRFFQAIGAWPTIAPAATAIREIHVSDRGRFGFTRMDARSEGLDALGWVVPNHVIGGALQPALTAGDAVRLLQPAVLGEVITDDAGVTAVVEGASGETVVRARLLVVADGARSPTRAALGIGLRARAYDQVAVITNVTAERPHGGRAFERFTREGPLALLPAGETLAVVWTVAADRAATVMDLPEAAFLVELQRLFGHRLGRLTGVGRRGAYPLSAVSAERVVGRRAVVVGNAAHTLHPVAGQGFNLALRDVATLAELLADDPGGLGEADRLADYARRRAGDFRRTFGFTDLLVRGFSNALPGVAALRNAGLVALDLAPGGRRALMQRAMGRHGWLPRLTRGLPLRAGEAG